MKKNYIVLVTALMVGYWVNLCGQNAPGQGEILITEMMVNPASVSDANGEWIEICNITNRDLLLNGLALKDAGSNHHVLFSQEKLVLPAKSYWILAKNRDALTNGGITPDYVYQNFTLSNISDQVILTDSNGGLIDQVSYTSGWPVVSGASMELHPDYLTFSGNDHPEHWFPAKFVFGAGDKGSPGKANPVSSGLQEWEQRIRLDIYPNPSVGRFILDASFPNVQSGEIRLINLLGQDYLYKVFSGQKHLKETIEPDFLTPGIWIIKVISGELSTTKRLIIEK